MSSSPPTDDLRSGPTRHRTASDPTPATGQPPSGHDLSERPRRPRGPAGWSLRTRLVATLLALLAVVCLLISVVTEAALHRSLVDQLDERLGGAAQRATDRPPGYPNGQDANQGGNDDYFRRGQLPRTVIGEKEDGILTAIVVQEDGRGQTPSAEILAALANLPADGDHRSYELEGLGNYRLTARQQGPDRVVIIGLPMDELEATQYRVAAILAGVTLAAMFIAGLSGMVIIRRSLRPLRRVAGTASRVAELRLDRGEVALAERVAPADTDPRTEVGQVGAALNRMLGNVTTALEARHESETRVRQFVADASHELRTPLAAIRGYAELTRRGRDAVPPDVAHVLRRVESEAQRMTVLVEDMLLLARLDAGRPLEATTVDLAMLAVDAVSDAHAAGPDHDWRLDLPEEGVVVTGDPARLHQVIANLLSNARTHTPPGTPVTISVRTESATNQAVLSVIDAGPGVAPELLPHIFERFARGDTSRSRAAGSTGLGLSIVYAVVAAHHGRLTVDSVPGRTAFTVWLPLAHPSPAGPRSV